MGDGQLDFGEPPAVRGADGFVVVEPDHEPAVGAVAGDVGGQPVFGADLGVDGGSVAIDSDW